MKDKENKKEIIIKISFNFIVSIIILLILVNINSIKAACGTPVLEASPYSVSDTLYVPDEYCSSCDYIYNSTGDPYEWDCDIESCVCTQKSCPSNKPDLCAVAYRHSINYPVAVATRYLCYDSSALMNDTCCDGGIDVPTNKYNTDFLHAKVCDNKCCQLNLNDDHECANLDTDGDGINEECCCSLFYSDRVQANTCFYYDTEVYERVGGICKAIKGSGGAYIENCTECTPTINFYSDNCLVDYDGTKSYCCFGQCYNHETHKCCGDACNHTIGALQPVDEKNNELYGECCDINGDGHLDEFGNGREGFCTGQTPYCTILRARAECTLCDGRCVSQRGPSDSEGKTKALRVCSECRDNDDCIGDPNNESDDEFFECCHRNNDSSVCYDLRTENCCKGRGPIIPVGDDSLCSNLTSDSVTGVEDHGVCYKARRNVEYKTKSQIDAHNNNNRPDHFWDLLYCEGPYDEYGHPKYNSSDCIAGTLRANISNQFDSICNGNWNVTKKYPDGNKKERIICPISSSLNFLINGVSGAPGGLLGSSWSGNPEAYLERWSHGTPPNLYGLSQDGDLLVKFNAGEDNYFFAGGGFHYAIGEKTTKKITGYKYKQKEVDQGARRVHRSRGGYRPPQDPKPPNPVKTPVIGTSHAEWINYDPHVTVGYLGKIDKNLRYFINAKTDFDGAWGYNGGVLLNTGSGTCSIRYEEPIGWRDGTVWVGWVINWIGYSIIK